MSARDVIVFFRWVPFTEVVEFHCMSATTLDAAAAVVAVAATELLFE